MADAPALHRDQGIVLALERRCDQDFRRVTRAIFRLVGNQLKGAVVGLLPGYIFLPRDPEDRRGRGKIAALVAGRDDGLEDAAIRRYKAHAAFAVLVQRDFFEFGHRNLFNRRSPFDIAVFVLLLHAVPAALDHLHVHKLPGDGLASPIQRQQVDRLLFARLAQVAVKAQARIDTAAVGHHAGTRGDVGSREVTHGGFQRQGLAGISFQLGRQAQGQQAIGVCDRRAFRQQIVVVVLARIAVEGIEIIPIVIDEAVLTIFGRRRVIERAAAQRPFHLGIGHPAA